MNKGKTGEWYQGWLEREITEKRMAWRGRRDHSAKQDKAAEVLNKAKI